MNDKGQASSMSAFQSYQKSNTYASESDRLISGDDYIEEEQEENNDDDDYDTEDQNNKHRNKNHHNDDDLIPYDTAPSNMHRSESHYSNKSYRSNSTPINSRIMRNYYSTFSNPEEDLTTPTSFYNSPPLLPPIHDRAQRYSFRSTGDLSSVAQAVDYETLLTLALENAITKVDEENKRKQKRFTFLSIIGFLFITVLVIITTVTLTTEEEQKYDNPGNTIEDQQLTNEINTLDQDVYELNKQVENYQTDEDIDLLKKDIHDKMGFIKQLKHDQNIDSNEKQQLIMELQNEINDLKVVVKQLEQDNGGYDVRGESNSGQSPKDDSDNNGNPSNSTDPGAGKK